MTVSIIMAVYNGQLTLASCLKSIHSQTFTDYELIIINDSSTDSSLSILSKWQAAFLPGQLKIINNPARLGLTKSLNIGIRTSRGDFIARIDADDTWHRKKLTKQISFLKKHPDYGVIGTFYINIINQSRHHISLPKTNREIKQKIFHTNPFGHSCIVINRKLLELINGYDENVYYGQDRDLWFRCMPLTKFHNLAEFLCYRRADAGLSISHSQEQMWQGIKTRIKYIRKYNASPVNYFYLAEPLAIILAPKTINRKIRQLTRNLSRVNSKPAKNTQINILCINDCFLPSKFANAVARTQMALALARRPETIEVTLLYHGLPKAPLLINHKKIIETKLTGPYITFTKTFLAKMWNYLFFFINTFRLAFIKIPRHYSIIYMRVGAAAGLIITLRNLFSQRTLILEIHNFEFGSHRLVDTIYKYIFSRCHKLITISNHTRINWLRHHVLAHKIVVLPSGADVAKFNQITAAPHHLRQQLALRTDKRLILYFGHLYRHRGIEDILQAANLLSADQTLQFLLVGGIQEDIKFYQQYLNNNFPRLNNILFLGYIKRSQIPLFTKAVDLILVTYSSACPTVKTMSPMKLFESMASQTPIVAANLPRIRHILDKNSAAFYQPDNAPDLARKIQWVLSNYPAAQAKARLAHKQVRPYSWKNRAGKIIQSAIS